MSLLNRIGDRSGMAASAITAFIAGVFVTLAVSRANPTGARRAQYANINMDMMMVGMFSVTHRLQDVVLKTAHAYDDDPLLTQTNIKATRNEASVYLILGQHNRIAESVYISPTKDLIMLKYYANGNLKDFVSNRSGTTLAERRRWARQMVEGVSEIHRNGVRHSDIRLDQWVVDDELNARLSDFNASGYDACERLELKGSRALGLESYSHYMPRDPDDDNTVVSDLFALGSALYELEAGKVPFEGEDGEVVTRHFRAGRYPDLKGLVFCNMIIGCWEGAFTTALDLLDVGQKSCGL